MGEGDISLDNNKSERKEKIVAKSGGEVEKHYFGVKAKRKNHQKNTMTFPFRKELR